VVAAQDGWLPTTWTPGGAQRSRWLAGARLACARHVPGRAQCKGSRLSVQGQLTPRMPVPCDPMPPVGLPGEHAHDRDGAAEPVCVDCPQWWDATSDQPCQPGIRAVSPVTWGTRGTAPWRRYPALAVSTCVRERLETMLKRAAQLCKDRWPAPRRPGCVLLPPACKLYHINRKMSAPACPRVDQVRRDTRIRFVVIHPTHGLDGAHTQQGPPG
jgi:hypothetical protein